MRVNLLCKLANMHEFEVVPGKRDLPMLRCVRCGKQARADRSFTSDYAQNPWRIA